MRETAYAKLNLALHVRAREPDGYHRIETIFAFCEDGDVLTAARGGRAEPDADRARSPARSATGGQSRAAGGARGRRQGGADARQEAAGRLRARRRLGRRGGGAAAVRRGRWRSPRRSAPTSPPACSAGPRAARAGATGSSRSSSRPGRDAGAAGQSRRAAVDRGRVRGLGRRRPRPARRLARRAATTSKARRARLVPEIGDVLGALAGARVARMSGSGATCFGLYRQRGRARRRRARGSRPRIRAGGCPKPGCADPRVPARHRVFRPLTIASRRNPFWHGPCSVIRRRVEARLCSCRHSPAAPRLHRTGAAEHFGRAAAYRAARPFFCATKAARSRQASRRMFRLDRNDDAPG